MTETHEQLGPMSQADVVDETTVRVSVSVKAGIEHAFAVFTSGMGTWWAPDHHIGTAPMATVILEPRVGGRWYELGTDGSQCDWGIVLAWDPPHHVAFTWHLDGNFEYDPEAEHSSRVDVYFSAADDGTTLVELVHSGLDHHGPTWRKLRDAVGSPRGWRTALGRFVARLEN